jgi:hypothetical protein
VVGNGCGFCLNVFWWAGIKVKNNNRQDLCKGGWFLNDVFRAHHARYYACGICKEVLRRKQTKTLNMKKWFETHIGKSWRTTLIGYVVAAFVAIYPLLDADVDFDSKTSVKRYIIKLLIAGAVAMWGKYQADSAQVKHVDNKVETLKNDI